MIKDKDIPKWLSTIFLITFFFAIPLHIYLFNPDYLTSSLGYANGIETYTYTIEALHSKDLIQNAITNFWFDIGSLGYPLCASSQPFPNFFIATVMIILERWMTPLHTFRWIIVMTFSLIPILWYKAARNFQFSRIRSISFALLSLSVDSQLRTGFELDSYFLHGAFPRLFAMLFMPLAASKIYLDGLHFNNKDHSQAVFFTCLVYLCHLNAGLYCSTLSLVTLMIYILAKEFNSKDVKDSFKRWVYFHVKIFVYLSWWFIPLLISYPYSRRSTENTEEKFSISGLVDMFTNGDLFDYCQNYIWMTCLVTFGLCIVMKNLYGLYKFSTLQINQHQLFTTWLLAVTLLSIVMSTETSIANLFQRLIPCDLNVDPSLYLFGLHFCGVLFASISISSMINFCTNITLKSSLKKLISICCMMLFAIIMIRNSGNRVSERVTLVEVSDDFLKTLASIKSIPNDGRVLTHKKLGTGGPWDLVNIPYLIGKPGVFATGNKDMSSSIYLESLLHSSNISQYQLINFFSLYNVHFMVASISALESLTIDLHSFKHLATIYDMQFYQIHPVDYNFGYFDIVRLPGYIRGNLPHIRQPVSETLDLFSQEVLLYMNPSHHSRIMKESMVRVDATDQSFSEKLSSKKDFSVTYWNLRGKETDSEEAVQLLHEYYKDKWSSSIVVEQRYIGTEYHAIVHVTNRDSTHIELIEHILLKVTYHPFWRCSYFQVDSDYLLEAYDPNSKQDNRTNAPIHQVTPNFMAVTLPPGKYHIIFRYRFPGILKIMTVMLTMILIDSAFKCNLWINIILGTGYFCHILVIGMRGSLKRIKSYIWLSLEEDSIFLRKTPIISMINSSRNLMSKFCKFTSRTIQND